MTFESEAGEDLPEYVRPNLSCLEAHRAEVALARRRKWPCRAIAELLFERHGLRITGRAVSDFCRRRGIVKGVGETRKQNSETETVTGNRAPMPSLAPRHPKKKQTGKYVFRGGPLRTRSNGLLKEE